jgi:hypothetical protein
MLSNRRSEDEGSIGSVLMGVAGGKGGASAADTERDLGRTVCGGRVGLFALSASDSVFEKARNELACSVVRNWRI